jgi:hypothetical protein
MKNYAKYYLIICFTVFFSCKDKKNRHTTADIPKSANTVTVSLDAVNKSQAVNIADLVDSVRFIKLETTDESLIGEILHVIFHEGLYYVNDRISSSILVFDWTGKYKFKISNKGRGPGEYIEISRLLLDEKNRQILIYDVHSRKMIYYTFDGEFIKEVHGFSDGAVVRDLILLSDGSFLCYNPAYEERIKYWGVWKVDLSGKFDKFILKQTIPYPPQFRYDNPYFYKLQDNKVGLWRPDNNDILYFLNDTVIYRLSMKINKKTVTDFPEQKTEDISSQLTIVMSVTDKDNFIFTQWWDQSKGYADIASLYLKKENRSIVMAGIKYPADSDMIYGRSVRINCTDQILNVIDVDCAESLMNETDDHCSTKNKTFLKSMFTVNDDNPVLEILYLKK